MCLPNRLFKQDWKVVDNSITATNLLHQLRGSSKHHASEMLCLAVREESAERCIATLVARSAKRIHNDVSLETCFFRVYPVTAQCGDDLDCIFVSILAQKPLLNVSM